MNFLAHCTLAADASATWDVPANQHNGLLAGAIIADFSKGRVNPQWPQSLQAGIRLHRRIDAVSNQHAAILKSCARYPKQLRRFAPIFVDILADYHLSHNWNSYSKHDLFGFAQRCYAAVAYYQDYLPEHGRRFAAYMQDSNLLARYHEWPTIEQAIASSLRRLQRPDLTATAVAASSEITGQSVDDFHEFYADFRQQLVHWSNLMGAA